MNYVLLINSDLFFFLELGLIIILFKIIKTLFLLSTDSFEVVRLASCLVYLSTALHCDVQPQTVATEDQT